MHQDPAKVDRCFVSHIPAKLTQALCVGQDGISAHPSLLVGNDGRPHAVFWPNLVLLSDGLLAGEPMK